MKLTRGQEKMIVSFRINAIRDTENDESNKYIEFVNHLTAEFIPHSTFRYCFIDRESDDAMWNVTFDKVFFDLIKHRGWL